MTLLERLRGPEDLRLLDPASLADLAAEIRAFLVDAVSKTGGHLGSNLGAVELTLALHACFDFRRDRIVFDVGHQAYTHKILTGRLAGFEKLRQLGGISGFPKRSESPYDWFGTGHASTSLSAAVGFALARKMRGEHHHVVAVIGDGALTGGMALEALNHLGDAKLPVLVVLNDNEMSIAHNVGAISHYLNRMRTDPAYTRFKQDMKSLMRGIPMIGSSVARFAERFHAGVKQMVLPGMLFEDLGLKYIGPVDGHDLPALRESILSAKRLHEPVILHVATEKGKGYRPAERHPFRFHSAGKFCAENGEKSPGKGGRTYTEVFGQAMLDAARRDPTVVAVTAAMCDGTGLSEFERRHPDRFLDVGICEEHAVTMAAALAADGMRPVVAIYSTFLQRSYDQILHDVALQELPVVLALDRAGLVGDDGPTHHGVFDLSYLRTVPGMTILVPRDEAELARMMRTALSLPGPCAVRYPRGEGTGAAVPDEPAPVEPGEFDLLREGGDATLVGVGPLLHEALAAADALAAEGISLAVIDAKYVKPLPEGLLERLRRAATPVLTLEESSVAGGFGSGLLEALAGSGEPLPPFRILGVPDRFVEHGENSLLRAKIGLDAAGISRAARELVESARPRARAVRPRASA